MREESCIPTLIWNLSKEKLVFILFLKKYIAPNNEIIIYMKNHKYFPQY